MTEVLLRDPAARLTPSTLVNHVNVRPGSRKSAPHIPVDRIGVWIKDGPAKEYRRALEAVGPYASFTKRRAAGAAGVTEAVLGKDWTVVDGSVHEKPIRCSAEQGASRGLLVVWGPETSLKELFWRICARGRARRRTIERGDQARQRSD